MLSAPRREAVPRSCAGRVGLSLEGASGGGAESGAHGPVPQYRRYLGTVQRALRAQGIHTVQIYDFCTVCVLGASCFGNHLVRASMCMLVKRGAGALQVSDEPRVGFDTFCLPCTLYPKRKVPLRTVDGAGSGTVPSPAAYIGGAVDSSRGYIRVWDCDTADWMPYAGVMIGPPPTSPARCAAFSSPSPPLSLPPSPQPLPFRGAG